MEQHLLACPLLSRGAATTKHDITYVIIQGQGNVCKRCWRMFGISDWEHHRKSGKCKELFEKLSSSGFSDIESFSSLRASHRQPSQGTPFLSQVATLSLSASALTPIACPSPVPIQ